MRRVFYVLIILLAVTCLLFSGCNKNDLTKGMSAKEIILASNEAMQDVKTYEIDMEMTMKMPITEDNPVGTIEMKGSGLISVDPILASFDYDMEMGDTKMPMKMYLTVEDDSLTEYISTPEAEDQWMKVTIPFDEEMKKMMDPKTSLAISEKFIKEATIVGNETIDESDTVIIEVTADGEALKDIMGAYSLGQASADLFDQMFAAMDGISYKAWVNKETLYMTKFEMDLGSMLKGIVAGLPAEEQAELNAEEQAMLEGIEAFMTMHYSSMNDDFEIVIPEDVINNAMDMSKLLSSQFPTELPEG